MKRRLNARETAGLLALYALCVVWGVAVALLLSILLKAVFE